MRRWCRVLALAVAFATPLPLSAQVPPPPPMPDQPPGQGRDAAQKTGTARLSGRVTALDTGRPIRRAVIRLSGPEVREGRSVSTDADGRWELREVPAGRFTVSVTKGGFTALSYGQLRPFEAGKTIEVGEGQTVAKLDVALPRGGAVTGRVVDEFGEPVAGVNVSTLRFRYMAGQRQLTPYGIGDTTDDLGQYRLHGLPPGEYYLAARPPMFTFLGTAEDRTGYGQIYYPDALTPAEASRLTIGIGQETQNIVITLSPSRMARLSGTVTTSSGKPVRQGMVMLREAGNAMMFQIRPGMISDGAWTINGVSPGEYQLVAQVVDVEAIAATGTSVGAIPETVTERISVTGDDVSGISLVTLAGGTIQGSVRFEGTDPPAQVPANASALAMEMEPASMSMSSSAMIKPDWTFQIKGVTGRRLLRVGGLPPGWTSKSVRVGGTDVTDSGVEVKSGQELSDVEILFTRNAAEISGTVQTAKGTAVADYAVVLFAPEPERWGYQSRFVKVARPDQGGTFRLTGLSPASYLAVALDYVEAGEETNPEFLERIRHLGTTVRVDETDKKTLTLKLSER